MGRSLRSSLQEKAILKHISHNGTRRIELSRLVDLLIADKYAAPLFDYASKTGDEEKLIHDVTRRHLRRLGYSLVDPGTYRRGANDRDH